MANTSVSFFCFSVIVVMFSAMFCRAESVRIKAAGNETSVHKPKALSIDTPSFPLTKNESSNRGPNLVQGITSIVNTSFLVIGEFALLLIALFFFAAVTKFIRIVCLTQGQPPFHKLMFGAIIAPNAP